MIKVSEKVIEKNGNFIAEITVRDEKTGKCYYVVCQLGDLFYKTFESSYIDYVSGKAAEPKMVEGDDYLWWYVADTEEKSAFYDYYEETLALASDMEKSKYIKRKYSRLKKPDGNIKFEIVDKCSETVFACGPIGEVCQIKFYLSEEDRNLYVFYSDVEGELFILSEHDIKSEIDNDEFDEKNVIERFVGFSKAKKSRYYDLYYAMMQYVDGIIE